MPEVIGGDNLSSPIGIGLTDLPHDGGGKKFITEKNKEKGTKSTENIYN